MKKTQGVAYTSRVVSCGIKNIQNVFLSLVRPMRFPCRLSHFIRHPRPFARRCLAGKIPSMKPLRMTRALNMCFVALAVLFPANWMAGLAQAPLAQPRPAIIVSGTIRDPVGNPIAAASVSFEEKATSTSIEAKTAPNGTFSFLTLRAGTYIVRVQKEGFREATSGPLNLSLGQRKELDLVLGVAIAKDTSSSERQSSPVAPQRGAKQFDKKLEFDDKPSFTVAGITDSTNFGGHGSDSKLRTSESLAKETAAMKSGDLGETSASASEAARAADSHREFGDRAEHSGDPLVAVHEYEQAVGLDPSEQNYFAWGTELLLHRAIKPAAEVFEKATTLHPKSARMLAGLGAALYAGGSYEDAARRLCAAADLQRADPTPYLFLAKMEKATPDPLPCAKEELARFAHDQPTNAFASYYYAVALWKQSRVTERGSDNSPVLQQAEILLQRAIAADPKLDEAYVLLGTLYSAHGNVTQAISAFQRAIEVNSQSAEAHYRLGLAYKRTGEEQKSARELQLYKQADKSEAAVIEQNRREIRQFLIILKDQPQAGAPAPQKEK